MRLDLRLPAIANEAATGNRLGYSSFALSLQRELLAMGVEVTEDASISLYLGPPHLFEPTRGKRSALFSMWEVHPMPKDVVASLNRADVLIAPSQYCASLFRRNGVRPAISVVPLGIDPDDWPTAPRVRRAGEPLRFLWVNATDERKGRTFLGQAWSQAFTPRDPAHLTIKYSANPDAIRMPNLGTYRVHLISERFSWEQMRDLYCAHHVFLCTSTAEGFGMSPLEAMACGLLVISPRHTGLAEYIHKGVAWVVETDRVGMRYERAPDIRVTALAPKVSHLRALMRGAISEFEATEPMRVKAQAHAKQFTWQRSAETLIAALSRQRSVAV